nr:MAG TPA: hypothetical protein [Caudoviricetes sp.]
MLLVLNHFFILGIEYSAMVLLLFMVLLFVLNQYHGMGFNIRTSSFLSNGVN